MPMINDIASLVAEGQKTKPLEHKQNLDAADFQRLFLEEMTHQDPLNPMDQKDMMAQLAQLMEMSRNNETNEILKSMKSMEQVQSRIDSASLIGKQVLADSSVMDLKNQAGDINFILPPDPSDETGRMRTAAKLEVNVMQAGKLVQRFEYNAGAHFSEDAAGKAAKEANLAMLSPGVHSIRWNGSTIAGDPAADGAYQVVIRAANDKGMPIAGAGPAVAGYVKRVGLSGDEVTYTVGKTPGMVLERDDVSIKPGQIYQILPDYVATPAPAAMPAAPAVPAVPAVNPQPAASAPPVS